MSHPEVLRNRSIFTVILSIVALEMVMAEDARSSANIARPKGEPDIFVSAFLWSILTNLDAMIVRHVERMCQAVHRAWNLERRVNEKNQVQRTLV